jgi:hypothetical protein
MDCQQSWVQVFQRRRNKSNKSMWRPRQPLMQLWSAHQMTSNYMLCLRWSPIDFQMWMHQPLVSPSMHYISRWHPKAKLTAAGQHYKIIARNRSKFIPQKVTWIETLLAALGPQRKYSSTTQQRAQYCWTWQTCQSLNQTLIELSPHLRTTNTPLDNNSFSLQLCQR